MDKKAKLMPKFINFSLENAKYYLNHGIKNFNLLFRAN